MRGLVIRLLVPTVILVAILLALGFRAFAQEPWRPGDPQHREPPAGYFCQRQDVNGSVDAEHACGCVRICEKGQNGELIVREDPKCSSYCWKAHCLCGTCGKDTH